MALDLFDINICLICLCVGYMIKHFNLFSKLPNNFIPIILTILSGILYSIHHNINYFGIGMTLGLISIGSYEVIDQLINLAKEKGVDEICQHKKR